MAFTGSVGTVLSTPGNVEPGIGAPSGPSGPGPIVTLGVLMPDLQVVVNFGANKRILNGPGKNSVASHIQWSSVMPGGHHTFSCTVVDTERSGNTSTYRYGATVTLRQVGASAESGQVFWQGYLRTPIPNDDGTCDLVANGWHQLLAERDDALLWQTRYYGDWQPSDADGFALGGTSDAIDSSVNNASLGFSVKKGANISDGEQAQLVWYYANPSNSQVLPRRVGLSIYKNIVVPGGANPNYALKLQRYDGPTNKASLQTVDNYDTALANNNTGDDGSPRTSIINTPQPVIVLTLERLGGSNVDVGASFRVTVRDLRVNDLAPGDTYVSSQVLGDLASSTRMGFTVGSKVSTTTDNVLPLFWQQGSWWDLIQYLSVAENTKWGVWEANPNPELEFRDWSLGTTWTTNGYGTSATVIAQLQPDDEVYNFVDVAYTKGNSIRIRHVRAAVTPDPFAGLTPQRQRTFRIELRDPQPDETLATAVANRLALELGTEQYAGTVTGSYFSLVGVDRTCYEVRAGDLLTISDFPGGSRTVRVYGVDHRDDAPSTLTIGKVPSRLDRILFWAEQKRRRKGRLE